MESHLVALLREFGPPPPSLKSRQAPVSEPKPYTTFNTGLALSSPRGQKVWCPTTAEPTYLCFSKPPVAKSVRERSSATVISTYTTRPGCDDRSVRASTRKLHTYRYRLARNSRPAHRRKSPSKWSPRSSLSFGVSPRPKLGIHHSQRGLRILQSRLTGDHNPLWG